MSWNNTVVTNQGLALLAKLTSGTTLSFIKAQAGTGTVSASALSSQTAVSSPKQTLTFRKVSYPEAGTAAISLYLENDSLSAGYTAMQIGLYATDPDAGEILFMISQADSSGTQVPSPADMPGFTAEWTFYVAYGQASSVSVTVDPAHSVSQAEAEQIVSDAISAYETTVNEELADKADAEHVHSAADITSGVLPVTRGGTGSGSVDTTPTAGSTKMVTSGGVNDALAEKADAVHEHAADNITSGILPVARGGTGNSSVDTSPTSGSTKMVTSGGVYTALNNKQKQITSGTSSPSGGSNGDIYIQYTS